MIDGERPVAIFRGITRPVGEVFTFFDSKLVVVEDAENMRYSLISNCDKCALCCMECADYVDITGYCEDFKRSDKKDVHFEKFGVDF